MKAHYRGNIVLKIGQGMLKEEKDERWKLIETMTSGFHEVVYS